nr:hypothetical protein [Tanacetum cinerariifolium]
MVNTRTDADLFAAVQNTLQTLLPQIWVEIREEFRTSSGPSNAGGNPPPVTIHTWLERFNKQKPHSFEKATAPFFPRAEQERLKMEYHSIRQTGTETSTEFMQCFLRLAGFLGAAAGTEEEQAKNFQQRSSDQHQPTTQQSSHRSHGHHNDRHGSDRRAAGIEEEQAKNFQWGLHRSTLNHLMCMSYTDVAQVANAARNYEILHERDDDDTERPNKR